MVYNWRFNKKQREITYECWPREVDMFAPGSQPYPGWPVTFKQADNFNIKEGYLLPILRFEELDQVVTVMDQYTSEVVSSLRIKGNSWQPKVMYPGRYKIAAGEGSQLRFFYNLEAKNQNNQVLQIE